MGLDYRPRRQRATSWHWRTYSDEERRAADWEKRRYELLGGERGSVEAVAAALDLSVRTLQRYEFDGAPRWYELALIGLARAVPAATKRAAGK